MTYARPLPSTPFALVIWRSLDWDAGAFGCRYALLDEQGKAVWDLDLPRDWTADGDEAVRLGRHVRPKAPFQQELARVAVVSQAPIQISARIRRRPAEHRRRDRDGPVFGKAADVGDGIEQQSLARLIHLGGGLFEAKVQEVALTPAGCGAGHFFVLAAAEDFNVGILVEAVRVGAPTSAPLLRSVADHREHRDGGVGFRWSERFWGRTLHHGLGIDDERLAEDDVLA